MQLEEKPPGVRVCLDFGTAFSKASAGDAGGAHALAIGAAAGAEHPLLVPSVMFVDAGRILFGPPAMDRARAETSTRDPILSFKTILAARDLEPALALRIKPSVDPTGTLLQRDALILYLAYLDQLVRRAIAGAPALAPALADAPRRYTSPIWRTHAEGDRVMARLFDEAALISQSLGASLIDADGVSIAHAKVALQKSAATLGIGQLEAGVFEAHAAAAAYAAYARAPKRFVLVMDMGAGTTDFAGFERLEAEHSTLSEILRARQSCGLAGDEIDDLIAHLLMARYKGKDRAGQASTWRSLRLGARALKRDLFLNGKASAQIGRAKLMVKRDELYKAPRFKDFTRALTEICAASVRAVAAHAERANASEMSILLAGGGANLPFLAGVARAAAQRGAPKLNVEVALFGSDWRLPDDMDGRAADALPQVAISLGGALATLESVAAPTPEPGR